MVLVAGRADADGRLAFKLSAVPFHFWAPDVFEGATAEVAAFLSVASKAAALGLLVRLAVGFSFPAGIRSAAGLSSPPLAARGAARAAVHRAPLSRAGRRDLHLRQPGRLRPDEHEAAAGLFDHRPCRLHDDARGRGRGPGRARDAGRGPLRPSPSLVVYIGIYLFMNLAAFAIVAFLRNAIGSEEIADYAGLVRRSPGLAVCMAIVMFSLVGLPPLAGFRPSWSIFSALVEAESLAAAGHRRPEHRAEPVLLSARGAGDDLLARAALPRAPDDPAALAGRLATARC